MSRFTTLLHREWMQHHRGYLVLAIAPPLLLLIVLAFSRSSIDVDGALTHVVMAASLAVVTGIVLAVSWIAMAFQMPGLARRDQQDRSIEFWLSLPVGHAQSIGATLVFHALLMPLLALAIGWLLAPLVGLMLVALISDASAWLTLPWGLLLTDAVALLLRTALGITLATLWLSPLLLAGMVASATLKRWGIPAVIALSVVFSIVWKQVFGTTSVLGEALATLGRHAASALSPVGPLPPQIEGGDTERAETILQEFPRMAAESALMALRDLATAEFLAVLAVGAAAFAVLVALRRRNG